MGRASDLAEVGGGENIMIDVSTSTLFGLLLWRLDGRNHMAGKKRFFPSKVGNIPVEAGKNACPKKWTIDVGTVVLCTTIYFLASTFVPVYGVCQSTYECKTSAGGYIFFLN
jgi:hypothetical protein